MDDFSVYANGPFGTNHFGGHEYGRCRVCCRCAATGRNPRADTGHFSAGVTYFGATLSGGVLGVLTDADPDDTVKIRGFISWVEDFFAVVGIWYLLLRPSLCSISHSGIFRIALSHPKVPRGEAGGSEDALRRMRRTHTLLCDGLSPLWREKKTAQHYWIPGRC